MGSGRAWGFSAVCSLLCSGAYAQSTGGLTGVVVDPDGFEIPGVVVQVQGQATAADPVTVTTDAAGRFRLRGLVAGTYAVQVSCETFVPQRVPDVVVVADRLTPLQVALAFVDPPRPHDADLREVLRLVVQSHRAPLDAGRYVNQAWFEAGRDRVEERALFADDVDAAPPVAPHVAAAVARLRAARRAPSLSFTLVAHAPDVSVDRAPRDAVAVDGPRPSTTHGHRPLALDGVVDAGWSDPSTVDAALPRVEVGPCPWSPTHHLVAVELGLDGDASTAIAWERSVVQGYRAVLVVDRPAGPEGLQARRTVVYEVTPVFAFGPVRHGPTLLGEVRVDGTLAAGVVVEVVGTDRSPDPPSDRMRWRTAVAGFALAVAGEGAVGPWARDAATPAWIARTGRGDADWLAELVVGAGR